MLGIDSGGLDAVDRKILTSLLEQGGGPVGLKTVAVMAGETEDTIEEVYEPFLIQKGFLIRSPRGRVATENARRHLGLASNSPSTQQSLF